MAILTAVCYDPVDDYPGCGLLWSFQDLYVILSMAILALACIWHAVVYLIFLNYGTTTADFADMVAVIVIGGFYVIFNAAFFFHNVFIVSPLFFPWRIYCKSSLLP